MFASISRRSFSRRLAFPMASIVALLLPLGCDDGPQTCTPGTSAACACANGGDGAQICDDNGSFGACSCEGEPETPAPDAGPIDDGGPAPVDGGLVDSGPSPDDGGPGPVTDEEVFEAFSERLFGLWSGPATQTVLGDFPIMMMDFRAIDDTWVFGRVDLDSDNNLRFLFDIETVAGEPHFVYRNGGYFQGLLRDTRTVLLEAQPDIGYFRFCALDGGCAYVDAVFDFTADDRLEFDTTVQGSTHVVWNATRDVDGDAPVGFPVEVPVAAGAGFPDMPRAEVTVSFAALAATSPLFVALATESCTVQTLASCDFSRAYLTSVDAGETSTTVPFEQLHPGTYQAVAVFDVDGIPGPSLGDTFALPQALTVPNVANDTATVSLQVFGG